MARCPVFRDFSCFAQGSSLISASRNKFFEGNGTCSLDVGLCSSRCTSINFSPSYQIALVIPRASNAANSFSRCCACCFNSRGFSCVNSTFFGFCFGYKTRGVSNDCRVPRTPRVRGGGVGVSLRAPRLNGTLTYRTRIENTVGCADRCLRTLGRVIGRSTPDFNVRPRRFRGRVSSAIV